MKKEKLIFCGDLVCPFECQVDYSKVKSLFEGAIGIANLEGAILPNEEAVEHPKWNDKYSLYSSPDILEVIEDLNIRYVSLCNNHILDYKLPIEYTQDSLNSRGIKWWGLKNHDVLETSLNGKFLYLITFATFANEHSLNLFNPHLVLQEIQELREKEPDALIVVYPHWGVEKFYYPEPADRELAHACVDAGANLIVGHHPHIVQPIEVYKGVTIVYSLGNFILPQTFYGKKKLVYKQTEVQNELILEWDGEQINFTRLFYDRDTNILTPSSYQDITESYSLFGKEMRYGKYLRLYLSHASWLDIFFRTRYVASLTNEYISYLSRKLLRTFRKAMIAIGVHQPYKHSDSEKMLTGGGRKQLLNIRRNDDSSLSSKILFIGIDYRNLIGGVAAVENVYSQWIHPFKFIATTVAGNKVVKLLVFVRALFEFTWKMVVDRNVKIVHVHGASDASFWRKRIFIIIAKSFGKQIVYHMHGGGFKLFASKHPRTVRNLLKKCDCIVALSTIWSTYFENEYKHPHVVVIRNIIEQPVYNPFKCDECSTLLFLGKICQEKGIFDLLELLAEYKSVYEDKLRLIIGGNAETERLTSFINQHSLQEMVRFEGWIFGDKKRELLNQVDAFILPSYIEGLPISILEAMSYHLPIISTNVGGIPEIVKDGINGFLIEAGNKYQLKESIDKLIANKELREKMGDESAQMVKEYLPEHVMRQLSELYSKILDDEKIH